MLGHIALFSAYISANVFIFVTKDTYSSHSRDCISLTTVLYRSNSLLPLCLIGDYASIRRLKPSVVFHRMNLLMIVGWHSVYADQPERQIMWSESSTYILTGKIIVVIETSCFSEKFNINSWFSSLPITRTSVFKNNNKVPMTDKLQI